MKVVVYASTNTVGSRQETTLDIPDEEWEMLSEVDRDALCFEAAIQLVDWGYTT